MPSVRGYSWRPVLRSVALIVSDSPMKRRTVWYLALAALVAALWATWRFAYHGVDPRLIVQPPPTWAPLPDLEQKVSLRAEKLTIPQALAKLEQQSGVPIPIDPSAGQRITKLPTVTLDLQQVTLREAIMAVLATEQLELTLHGHDGAAWITLDDAWFTREANFEPRAYSLLRVLAASERFDVPDAIAALHLLATAHGLGTGGDPHSAVHAQAAGLIVVQTQEGHEHARALLDLLSQERPPPRQLEQTAWRLGPGAASPVMTARLREPLPLPPGKLRRNQLARLAAQHLGCELILADVPSPPLQPSDPFGAGDPQDPFGDGPSPPASNDPFGAAPASGDDPLPLSAPAADDPFAAPIPAWPGEQTIPPVQRPLFAETGPFDDPFACSLNRRPFASDPLALWQLQQHTPTAGELLDGLYHFEGLDWSLRGDTLWLTYRTSCVAAETPWSLSVYPIGDLLAAAQHARSPLATEEWSHWFVRSLLGEEATYGLYGDVLLVVNEHEHGWQVERALGDLRRTLFADKLAAAPSNSSLQEKLETRVARSEAETSVLGMIRAIASQYDLPITIIDDLERDLMDPLDHRQLALPETMRIGDELAALLAPYGATYSVGRRQIIVHRDSGSTRRWITCYDIGLLLDGPHAIQPAALAALVEKTLVTFEKRARHMRIQARVFGRVLCITHDQPHARRIVERLLAALSAGPPAPVHAPYDLGLALQQSRTDSLRPIRLYSLHDLAPGRWRSTGPQDDLTEAWVKKEPEVLLEQRLHDTQDRWLLLATEAPLLSFVERVLARARAPAGAAHDVLPVERFSPRKDVGALPAENWLLQPVTLHRWSAKTESIVDDLCLQAQIPWENPIAWQAWFEEREAIRDFHATNVPLGIALQLALSEAEATFMWRTGRLWIGPANWRNDDDVSLALYPALDFADGLAQEPVTDISTFLGWHADDAGGAIPTHPHLPREWQWIRALPTANHPRRDSRREPTVAGEHLLVAGVPADHLAWQVLLQQIATPASQRRTDPTVLVTVDEDKTPLCDVLDKLARQHDLAIAIDPQVPAEIANLKITCHEKDQPLEELVRLWLSQASPHTQLLSLPGVMLLTTVDADLPERWLHTRVYDVQPILDRYCEMGQRQLFWLAWDLVGRQHWHNHPLNKGRDGSAWALPGRLLVRQTPAQHKRLAAFLRAIADGSFDALPRPALLFADDADTARAAYVQELCQATDDARTAWAAFWLVEARGLNDVQRAALVDRLEQLSAQDHLPQVLALCRVLMAQPAQGNEHAQRLLALFRAEDDTLVRRYLLAALAAQREAAIGPLVGLLPEARPPECEQIAAFLKEADAEAVKPWLDEILLWGLLEARDEHNAACTQLFDVSYGLLEQIDADAAITVATLEALALEQDDRSRTAVTRAQAYLAHWDAFHIRTTGGPSEFNLPSNADEVLEKRFWGTAGRSTDPFAETKP